MVTDTQNALLCRDPASNRNDTKTLQGLLHALRGACITAATFVFDGGMSSRINLEAMDKAAWDMPRLSHRPQNLADEVGLEGNWNWEMTAETTHESKRYVLVGGPWRQQRDQERPAMPHWQGRKES